MSRKLFSLVELLLILACLAILLALLLPSLGRMRVQYHNLICKSNLHQIGAMLENYREDFHGWAPPAYSDNNQTSSWHYEYWPEFLFIAGHLEPNSDDFGNFDGGNIEDRSYRAGFYKANTMVDMTCPSGEDNDGRLGRFVTWYDSRVNAALGPAYTSSDPRAYINLSYSVPSSMGRKLNFTNPSTYIYMMDKVNQHQGPGTTGGVSSTSYIRQLVNHDYSRDTFRRHRYAHEDLGWMNFLFYDLRVDSLDWTHAYHSGDPLSKNTGQKPRLYLDPQ